MRYKKLTLSLALMFLIVSGGIAWAVFSWVIHKPAAVKSAANLEPVVTVQSGVSGLYPGAVMPFAVDVKNPNPYPIRVTNVEGHNPKMKSGCKDYSVALIKNQAQLDSLVISGGKVARLDVKVTMKDWVGKECADQTLPIDVVVSATQSGK